MSPESYSEEEMFVGCTNERTPKVRAPRYAGREVPIGSLVASRLQKYENGTSLGVLPPGRRSRRLERLMNKKLSQGYVRTSVIYESLLECGRQLSADVPGAASLPSTVTKPTLSRANCAQRGPHWLAILFTGFSPATIFRTRPASSSTDQVI